MRRGRKEERRDLKLIFIDHPLSLSSIFLSLLQTRGDQCQLNESVKSYASNVNDSKNT